MIDSRLEDRIDSVLSGSSLDRITRICLLTAKQERKLHTLYTSGEHDKAEALAQLLINLNPGNEVAFQYLRDRYRNNPDYAKDYLDLLLGNAISKLNRTYDI